MDNKHPFDLEERTTIFAQNVIHCCVKMSRNPINDSLIRQVVRSAGSVGANYREANDALGAKDFVMRLRISRKEAKETFHWLCLLRTAVPDRNDQVSALIKESLELKDILSAMLRNAKDNRRDQLGEVWVR